MTIAFFFSILILFAENKSFDPPVRLIFDHFGNPRILERQPWATFRFTKFGTLKHSQSRLYLF